MEGEKSKLLPGTEPVVPPRRCCRRRAACIVSFLGLVVLFAHIPLSRRLVVRAPLPIPAPRQDGWWRALHGKYLAEVAAIDAGQAKPYGVIFYGDSITESWNGLDHGFPVARAVGVDEVFRKHFGSFDARAFGIGGDESGHLLWRLLHGELPNGTTASGSSTSPRVAVLNIGTNDLGAARRGSTLSEAYASVNAAVPGVLQRIVQTVRLFRRAAPDTHLVLQALLPRSRDAGGDDQFLQPSVYTDALDSINDGLHALAAEDGHLHFVDCNDGLYDAADGSLVPELLPDGLHPSKDGYDRIGSCLAVTVRQLWDRSAPEFEAQRTAPATTRALPDGDAKAAEAHKTIQALLAKVRAADEAGEGLDAKVGLPDDLGFVSKNGRGQVSAFPSLDEADRTKLHSVRGRRHHHHHRDDAERRHSGRHYGSAFRDRDHDRDHRDRRRSRPAAAVALPMPLGSSKADEAEMRGIFDALKLVDDEAKRARREGRPDAKVVAILGDDGNGAVAMVQGGAAGASSVAVDAAGADVSSKAVSGVHRVSTHLTLPLSMPALTLRPAVNAVNAEDLEKAQEAMNRAFGLTFGAATNSADPAASASAASTVSASAAASSLSSLVEGSMEAFSSISDAVIKAIRESLDAARPAAQAAGEVVQKAAQSAAQTAQKAAAEAAEASREATTEATEKAREAAAEASSEAQEAAAEATERARQAAAAAMEASHDAAEKAADAMRQAFGRLGK